MKLTLAFFALVTTTTSFAQSHIADRVRDLEARVAALEARQGGRGDVYCVCRSMGYGNSIELQRVSGSGTVTLSYHSDSSWTGGSGCQEALERHPSCY
jgi:hypothetical protein